MNRTIVFTNCRVLTPLQQINDGAILIEGGIIRETGRSDTVGIPENAQVIDVKGAYISPGFIDLHLHGGWGGDVMAGSIHDLTLMAQGELKGGVTAFLPTTLSDSLPNIEKAVDQISQAMRLDLGGAQIIGVHLEGPYFNPAQKGAQNPEYIINPNPDDYLPLLDRYSCIKRVSAAPEIPGTLELGRELQKRGIVASIGHSGATYQEVLRAVESGYTHATHMFSAMSTVERIKAYRIAGVVESVLLLDELTTELIADGHHLPPSLMRLVLKTKGPDKVCLVTDSMAAAGLGPGKYDFGGLAVIVEDEIPEEFEIAAQEGNYVAKLADRSAFASSVATMDQLVRNMVKLVGLSVLDAVKLVTVNPARMQKLSGERGLLSTGMRADLTVFDEDINILLTMVGGKILYQNEAKGRC